MATQALNVPSKNKSTIGRSYFNSSNETKTTKPRRPESASAQPRPDAPALPALPASVRWALSAWSLIAPGLAARMAQFVFLRPPRFRAPLRELWWETEAESLTVPMAGSSGLRAWQWGHAGPTVILVHGWGGRGLQLGAFAQPLVEAGFRVLALDLPAHGRSPGRSTSLPEAAKAVQAAIEFASRRPGGVHGLIAHSFGCAASSVALAEGAPVEKVVFVAPPSDLDGVTRRFSELTGFSLEVMRRMRSDLERRFSFTWADVHPRRLIPSLEASLLVVHDIADREVPWTEGQRLADLAGAGRLHLTSGLGHFRILRDEGVLDSVSRYLSQAPSAAEAA